jgi:hypothetical protein
MISDPVTRLRATGIAEIEDSLLPEGSDSCEP